MGAAKEGSKGSQDASTRKSKERSKNVKDATKKSEKKKSEKLPHSHERQHAGHSERGKSDAKPKSPRATSKKHTEKATDSKKDPESKSPKATGKKQSEKVTDHHSHKSHGHSKTEGNKDDNHSKKAGHSPSKKHTHGSEKHHKHTKAPEHGKKKCESPYSNLASLVEKTPIKPKATDAARQEQSPPPADTDSSGIYKLANGMMKAHDAPDPSNSKTSQAPNFRGLSHKVDSMRLTSSDHIIDHSKMNKLASAMAKVSEDLNVGGEQKEQDGDHPDFKGLVAAKKFGTDAAKFYHKEASKMHNAGKDILRKSAAQR